MSYCYSLEICYLSKIKQKSHILPFLSGTRRPPVFIRPIETFDHGISEYGVKPANYT